MRSYLYISAFFFIFIMIKLAYKLYTDKEKTTDFLMEDMEDFEFLMPVLLVIGCICTGLAWPFVLVRTIHKKIQRG